MNVKELWAYRDAVKALTRAREALEEYESVIYSPNGARASGIPLERSHNSPDRLAIIVDKHDKLLIEEERAKLQAHEAFTMLEDFGKTLPEDELDVFKLRWLKGLSHREISAKLHRSEPTVKRMTHKIKDKFRKFEKIDTV